MTKCNPNKVYDCPVLDCDALIMTSGCYHSWQLVCTCSVPDLGQLYHVKHMSNVPYFPCQPLSEQTHVVTSIVHNAKPIQ